MQYGSLRRPSGARRNPSPNDDSRRVRRIGYVSFPHESRRVEASKRERSTRKQHRHVNSGKGVSAQRLRLTNGVEYLDITNPEVASLADFLTGMEAIKLGPANGDNTTAHSEDKPIPSVDRENLLGANHHRGSSESDQSKWFYP